MLEHRRVLFANSNGQAGCPLCEDIKLFIAYIFEVNLEYFNAINDRDYDFAFAGGNID